MDSALSHVPLSQRARPSFRLLRPGSAPLSVPHCPRPVPSSAGTRKLLFLLELQPHFALAVHFFAKKCLSAKVLKTKHEASNDGGTVIQNHIQSCPMSHCPSALTREVFATNRVTRIIRPDRARQAFGFLIYFKEQRAPRCLRGSQHSISAGPKKGQSADNVVFCR